MVAAVLLFAQCKDVFQLIGKIIGLPRGGVGMMQSTTAVKIAVWCGILALIIILAVSRVGRTYTLPFMRQIRE